MPPGTRTAGTATSTQGGAASGDGSAAQDAQTDTVVDGLLQLMGQAQRDLLIISPYFVPGADMKAAFAAARARGVRVRVLTNSLASNDAPIAHAGYARHRKELLAMGVELYEMRSELTGVLRGSLGSGSMGGPDGGASGSTGGSRSKASRSATRVLRRPRSAGSASSWRRVPCSASPARRARARAR